MIEALFSQPNYVATKQMLDATMLRHEAIASNLANVENPNYQRLDVDSSFKTELSRALARQDPLAIQSVRPSIEVDHEAVAANLDGNSVQLENELMNLSQNYVAHGLETRLITGQLNHLRLAITGRAS